MASEQLGDVGVVTGALVVDVTKVVVGAAVVVVTAGDPPPFPGLDPQVKTAGPGTR